MHARRSSEATDKDDYHLKKTKSIIQWRKLLDLNFHTNVVNIQKKYTYGLKYVVDANERLKN